MCISTLTLDPNTDVSDVTQRKRRKEREKKRERERGREGEKSVSQAPYRKLSAKPPLELRTRNLGAPPEISILALLSGPITSN